MNNQLIEQIRDASPFEKIAHIFGLLGDSSRLRVFWFLCHCEECVMGISDAMNMTSPAISHHLKQLKADGLILSRREGKEVFYRASDVPESVFLHEAIEEIMEISCPGARVVGSSEGYSEGSGESGVGSHAEGSGIGSSGARGIRTDQLQTIRRIHDYLLENLEKRITIDDLSSMFLMNGTTIKKIFKEVYGNSIAAHTKEHRMEHAASMLKNSDESIADIAGAVGYSSQSKFGAAFQEHYRVLPSEFRKKKI